MRSRDRLFIGGEWVEPAGRDSRPVLDPSTGAAWSRAVLGNVRDAEAAVRAAADAFAGWSRAPAAERAAALRRVHAALERRAGELADTITAEVGMPRRIAGRVQVEGPLHHWLRYAELAQSFAFEHRQGHSIVQRLPVGVVAAITPWNFPFNQATLKVAPALAAGCTVVLKPSEVTPLNAFLLADAIDEADLPPGVFNLVTGTGPEVGEYLAVHPEVDMVSLTGSTRAGRRVAELAAASVKRVGLELGGKSASIVLPGADFERAVTATLSSCLLNSGQACSALTRLLVPRERLPEVGGLASQLLKRMRVGPANDPASVLGPLVSGAQRDRVNALLDRALQDGATVLASTPASSLPCGGGFYVAPVVLLVAPDSEIAREEVFGPVLCVMPYDSVDEAVRIANDSIYGLAGAVWGPDDDAALAVAGRLRTGQIDINGARWNPAAPFGGFRQSGLGRENDAFGLEEYLEYRAIQLPQAQHG